MKAKALEKKDTVLFERIFILFFLFSLTLGLGIFVATKLTELLEAQEAEVVPISIWQFLLNFLLAILLVLAIFFLGRKFEGKKRYLLKMFFLTATGIGSLISLGVFVGDLAIFLVLILIALWLRKPCVFLQDILMILGIAGAGSLLGIRLNPEAVVLLLVLFSVYDYISVYKTKHMVKMAEEMIKEGAILGFVLPQKISDFRAPLERVRPGGSFFVLGGGDIAFPLLLCCSLVTKSLFFSVIVGFFSLIGLFFSFFIFSRQKTRQPIPALPPIALFSIIGFLITLLI